jgi:hypothetical protein
MNPPIQETESRSNTYLKNAALALPPLGLWIFMGILVVPKLQEICAGSATVFPAPLMTALTVSAFVKNNLLLGGVVVVAALILLEWRLPQWNRYRRIIVGATAYLLNLTVLAILAVLCLLAVIAAIPAAGK